MKLRPKGNVKNDKHWSHMFAPVIGISLKTSADSQNRSENTQLQPYQSKSFCKPLQVHESCNLNSKSI